MEHVAAGTWNLTPAAKPRAGATKPLTLEVKRPVSSGKPSHTGDERDYMRAGACDMRDGASRSRDEAPHRRGEAPDTDGEVAHITC